MSISLIESEHRSQRSLGGTFVSIALHASLITLAVYATASAGVVSVSTTPDTLIKFYPPRPTDRTPRQNTAVPSGNSSATGLPHPLVFEPIKISDPKLPSLDVAAMDTLGKGLFGAAGTNSRNAATSQGSDAGSPMIASQVDKPAVPRDGNPIPKYPSMLESSRIEGSVLVQFVVDTLGRADMSTFAIFESSNDLFAESFKTTLPRWRFYPAEAGGRKVEQVVQLPLKFIAPPR